MFKLTYEIVMSDLEIARSRLIKENLRLTIVKKGDVLFETSSHRISGFLGAIEKLGDKLEGASVADCVVGKAIALLCVYSRITEVYAEVLSVKAKITFEKNGILCEWKTIVDNILDSTGTDSCPLEKTAESISDPEKAYVTLKSLLQSNRTCK